VVIVIGGINQDIKGAPDSVLRTASSNPGKVWTSPGGVGGNIAVNLAMCGIEVSLLSLLGDDQAGQRLLEFLECTGVGTGMLRILPGARSGTYLAIQDSSGELVAAVSDMEILEHLSPVLLGEYAGEFRHSECLIADANLPVDSLRWIARFAREYNLPLVLEPVSVEKAARLKDFSLDQVWISPNADEFRAVFDLPPAVWNRFISQIKDSPSGQPEILDLSPLTEGANFFRSGACPSDRTDDSEYPDPGEPCAPVIFLTLGASGVILMSRDPDCPSKGLCRLPKGNSSDQGWHGWRYPALKAVPRDVNGAGDAFTAGLVSALLHRDINMPIEKAICFAQSAAVLTLESEQTSVQDISVERIMAKLNKPGIM